MSNRTYIAIDLKSIYASVECVELGLDPLTTNLMVADKSRTEQTICLAVSFCTHRFLCRIGFSVSPGLLYPAALRDTFIAVLSGGVFG